MLYVFRSIISDDISRQVLTTGLRSSRLSLLSLSTLKRFGQVVARRQGEREEEEESVRGRGSSRGPRPVPRQLIIVPRG